MKGQKKQYVQDLLKTKENLIYRFLFEQKGRVYVCGKIAMAEEVYNAIVDAIQKNLPKDSKTTGAQFVQQMKTDGRYNQDLFG